jgi:hypothetical protein
MTIIHRPGRIFILPDIQSRLIGAETISIDPSTQQILCNFIYYLFTPTSSNTYSPTISNTFLTLLHAPTDQPFIAFFNETIPPPVTQLLDQIKKAQEQDEDCKQMKQYINNIVTPPSHFIITQWKVKDDILYHRIWERNDFVWRIWAPPSIHTSICELVHDKLSGHQGFFNSHALLSQLFYHKNLRRQIKQHIKHCHTCQVTKHSHQKPQGLLHPAIVLPGRWENIQMDWLVDLPTTSRGHNSIWSIGDKKSGRKHFWPAKITDTATTLATTFIQQYYPHHGIPKRCESDRDPRLTSDFWQEVSRMLGMDSTPHTAHHSQASGFIENGNGTGMAMLLALIHEYSHEWDT